MNFRTASNFRLVDENVVIRAINEIRTSAVGADGLSIDIIK